MITLNLTPLQYDIVKAAVAHYADNLIQIVERPTTTVTVTTEAGTVTAKAPLPWDSPDAPYGFKKDGTPRARPGRKSAKVRKARA